MKNWKSSDYLYKNFYLGSSELSYDYWLFSGKNNIPSNDRAKLKRKY